MIYKIQQYSEHSHRFEEEMMQIGMNQVNNMKLINGNQAVKYSYFEYLEQNTSRGPIHVQVHSYPLLGSRPTWERDAIGYRDDSNVRTALKRFQSKVNTPQHVHTVSLLLNRFDVNLLTCCYYHILE